VPGLGTPLSVLEPQQAFCPHPVELANDVCLSRLQLAANAIGSDARISRDGGQDSSSEVDHGRPASR
jgi:hypothetical protein